MPFASLAGDDLDAPSYDPAMFLGDGRAVRPATGRRLPIDWRGIPEDRLLSSETRAVMAARIADLPPMQAEVIRLRDVAGMDVPRRSVTPWT